MNWQEFKKEWQELPKARKIDLACYILLSFACTALILLGLSVTMENVNKVPDEVRLYGGGILVTSFGFWLFNYFYARSVDERMHRLREELEKAKENGYLGEE